MIDLYESNNLFFFFFYCYGDHRDLHSFPTRRSSDLWVRSPSLLGHTTLSAPGTTMWRSEEHTSELQSLRHLVCRLLLEKKNILSFNNFDDIVLSNYKAPR